MARFKMTLVDWSALTLIVAGAINWGLVGIGYVVDSAANWNLVNVLLGSVPELEFAIYVLVGLAGLYTVFLGSRIAGIDVPEPEMEGNERGMPK